MDRVLQPHFKEQLKNSVFHGFIDSKEFFSGVYAPKLILNKPDEGQYVLTSIQDELNKCLSFSFSVAFISQAGIAMLKTQLSDLYDKNVKGKILISPYLGFNDPNAMRELLKLKNVEVRITKKEKNMHSKCYIFNHGLEQVAIIGSSNLTHTALKVNHEWNIKLTSSQHGDFLNQTQVEFSSLWEDSLVLNEELIKNYSDFRTKTITIKQTDLILESSATYGTTIQPNAMQKKALEGIREKRNKGAKRALIISATGTGKTYLSAFDVKEFQPKKFLFIVHREQILRKAKSDYKKILNFSENEAIIYKSGDTITNAKYIFTTIQTLSKDNNLHTISPESFDYILIDEVHKAGAPSYQKIINYFKPEFLLGMTATPERTDDFNIYELFNYNIAYEIRLQAALNEEMLCPFMYYGVKDVYFNGELINEKAHFSKLIDDIRVRHIIDKIDYYSVTGVKTKGLIFCSNKREAHELSLLLNEKGKKTVALTGEDSQDYRQKTIQCLENGEIEYILTVDIFNEGIDIPSINQVIMLRNTESSIIFIQQLGRGLRKHPSKEFVTVIDFIGNYSNNYLIPIALFGDNSLNKDNYRRKLTNRNQIAGISTINFEEIACQQIFNSIKNTTLSSMANLKEKYFELKNRLGRTPYLTDYIEQDQLDPVVFFERSFKNYSEVIAKFNKTKNSFSIREQQILNFLSIELLNGKRIDELLLLKLLVEHNSVSLNSFTEMLLEYGIKPTNNRIQSIIRVLSLEFFQEATKKRYGNSLVVLKNKTFTWHPALKEFFKSDEFVHLIKDTITAGLIRSKKYNLNSLTIGEKYSRKDVCRLLYWNSDESSTMYGYKIKHQTCPIFVTYHKDDSISETTQYQDSFINESVFHWFTRSRRTLKSHEVQNIINSATLGIALHLFVKKEDGEGTDFYYLGPVSYQKGSAIETKMPKTEEDVVTMNLSLAEKTPYSLYQYLLSN
ncbi:DEAD/DEAH box helicase [Tuanshanicoccus lijuaniae]|uniref:DEAD/DEAH box helicase n=1 Tax=Aerococcaceae bacterium zg-1292 TaxID=2774330 RepID=UPI001BD8F817|nr:DEAD/DEAH box helicase [Aerococcaceae bacterium zg-A91]MBS4458522.1 DEAD/DEAH box helicase [Aerococcaceae bacterium zg-BR33]